MHKAKSLESEALELAALAVEQMQQAHEQEAIPLFAQATCKMLDASLCYLEQSRAATRYSFLLWIALTVLYIGAALLVIRVLF